MKCIPESTCCLSLKKHPLPVPWGKYSTCAPRYTNAYMHMIAHVHTHTRIRIYAHTRTQSTYVYAYARVYMRKAYKIQSVILRKSKSTAQVEEQRGRRASSFLILIQSDRPFVDADVYGRIAMPCRPQPLQRQRRGEKKEKEKKKGPRQEPCWRLPCPATGVAHCLNLYALSSLSPSLSL